jgi:hypothetical protein
MAGQQAGLRLRCKTCKQRFTRVKGSRRIHCETCRPPRARSVAPAEVLDLVPKPPRPLGELEGQALADLQAAGRAQTTEGALALYLARQLDAGGHTGSQTAALAARLMDAKTRAVAGAKPKDDFVDELRRRREARAAKA